MIAIAHAEEMFDYSGRIKKRLDWRIEEGFIEKVGETYVVSPEEYQWLKEYKKLIDNVEKAICYLPEDLQNKLEQAANNADDDDDTAIISLYIDTLINNSQGFENAFFKELKEDFKKLQKEKLPDFWFMY